MLNLPKIEFHILQSFPVTCLNRDDIGSPKTANIGGVVRARVSSQCWKRAIRLKLHELGGKIGIRTENLSKLLIKRCENLSVDKEKVEKVTKIVTKFMQIRFENNPYVQVDQFTDVAIINVQDVNVMIEHGEDSNLQTTIEYFSNLYNIDIDECIAGHLHRPESKGIGITDIGNRAFYRVGSVCGIDPFSKRIRQASRPSAYFAVYGEDGHGWSRDYILG